MELINTTWIHRENKLSSPAMEKSLLRKTDLGQNSYLKKEKIPLADAILTIITIRIVGRGC